MACTVAQIRVLGNQHSYLRQTHTDVWVCCER